MTKSRWTKEKRRAGLRSGPKLAWTPEALEYLKREYPGSLSVKTIAKQVRHHPYTVIYMARHLGLKRGACAPTRKSARQMKTHSNPHAVSPASFRGVCKWLRKQGYTVKPGRLPGTWTAGAGAFKSITDATPQQLIRMANNVRIREHGLAPFVVNTGGGTDKAATDLRSLTGGCIHMEIVGLGG